MGDTGDKRRGRRRLLVSTGVVLLASALLAEPAMAQLPLGSPSNGAAPSLGSTLEPVTQAVPTEQVGQQAAPLAQQVAQPLASATEPVEQVVAPVVQTAAPVVQQVAQPAVQAAAPVVEAAAPVVTQVSVPVAQVGAPVVQQVAPVIQQTTAPVLAAAEPVVQAVAPILDAAEPLVESAAPVLEATGPVLEPTTSQLGASIATGPGTSAPRAVSTVTEPGVTTTVAPSASDAAAAQPAPADAASAGTATSAGLVDGYVPTTRAGRAAMDRSAPDSPSIAPTAASPWVTDATLQSATAAGHEARSAKASPPRRPTPGVPEAPLGLLVELAAAYGSSALLVFVAALAALFLAAPQLGRWLRLRLARWPLPIPLPSLERPG